MSDTEPEAVRLVKQVEKLFEPTWLTEKLCRSLIAHHEALKAWRKWNQLRCGDLGLRDKALAEAVRLTEAIAKTG